MHDEDIGSFPRPTASGEDGAEQRPGDDRLTWTAAEAARLLGISKDTAYEAARRGELPVQMIGRRMLVPRMALLHLLGQETKPGARSA